MKIFISHSSNDKNIAIEFSHFLESLDNNITVFCTALNNAIRQGEDYVQAIDRAMSDCDMFIPLLSENYFQSKYSMIELGFSYSLLYSKKKESHIFPFSIPPIDKGIALLSTPLSRIQVSELTTEIHAFVKLLKDGGMIQNNYSHNNDINSFIDRVQKVILIGTNVFNQAIILPICSEGERKESIKISKEGNDYTVTLIPLENGRYIKYPSFLSCVLKFPKKIDLYQFLKFNGNAAVQFEFESYTDSLKSVDLEFKYSDTPQLFAKHTLDISKGRNKFSILLNGMNLNGLRNISEICFVVWDSYMKEDEGSYCIRDLKIVI